MTATEPEQATSGKVPRTMAVYVDEPIWRWQGLNWAHLLADEIDELHRFAYRLGIQRTSFQAPPRSSSPHYDITAFERRKALAYGAVSCSRAEIVAVLRRNRQRVLVERASLSWLNPSSLT